jgi:dynactin complex subunit
MPNDEPSQMAALLTEQLGRFKDRIESSLNVLETEQRHQKEINDLQKQLYEGQIDDLKKQVSDHETRIRAATDGVTQFKTWSGIISGGSFIAAIAAFLKAFIP